MLPSGVRMFFDYGTEGLDGEQAFLTLELVLLDRHLLAFERVNVKVEDELNNQLSERMNRTMYVLTIFAALLLPPSLLTGLFGINVGGMPGVESRWAFTIVVIALPALAVIQFIQAHGRVEVAVENRSRIRLV